jgi:hypothetical protein
VWLRDQAATSAGPWDLYLSRLFAETWYGARAAGERIRGLALERLYRIWQRPGGPHPDPREPAAFSSGAVLSVSASLLGLHISTDILLSVSKANGSKANGTKANDSKANVITASGNQSVQEGSQEDGGQHYTPSAWIITYPMTHHGRKPPAIAVSSLDTPSSRLLEFEIACLLGLYHHEQQRISDPDAPAGSIFLPHDPGVQALLHQYAIALLCLRRDCPSSWDCHCNEIRARFNAPPPDHMQPTGTLSATDLKRATRTKRDTEPHFPFNDPNIWTDDERANGSDPLPPAS